MSSTLRSMLGMDPTSSCRIRNNPIERHSGRDLIIDDAGPLCPASLYQPRPSTAMRAPIPPRPDLCPHAGGDRQERVASCPSPTLSGPRSHHLHGGRPEPSRSGLSLLDFPSHSGHTKEARSGLFGTTVN